MHTIFIVTLKLLFMVVGYFIRRSAIIKEDVGKVLSTVIVVALCIPLSRLLSKYLGRTEAEKNMYGYSLCFPNSGYIGYPLISAILGEEMLLSAMMFCIPLNLVTYTYGALPLELCNFLPSPAQYLSHLAVRYHTDLSPFLPLRYGDRIEQFFQQTPFLRHKDKPLFGKVLLVILSSN